MEIRGRWEFFDRRGRHDIEDYPGCRWNPQTGFLAAASQENDPDALLRGDWRFLATGRPLGWPPDWSPSGLPKLWVYHLHYFDYLWALPFERGKELVTDWIRNHPLNRRGIGWGPFPCSVRLINWCGFFFGQHRSATEQDESFRDLLWRSLHVQADRLAGHLETHLLGNHLFENGAALALVGSCFRGSRGERWFGIGEEILRRELPEQMLADGMHFERSPMYHARVTYLMALLLGTDDPRLRQLTKDYFERALEALEAIVHPEGSMIALFNDSALGVTHDPGTLRRFAGGVPARSHTEPDEGARGFALNEAGYYGCRTSRGDYVICDAGPIGPDYLPGHAHGDIFSFELSLGGHRVIVDSGVFDYEEGPMRRYCRSTRAHNTVEIDGEDQCEFWKVFRVARRGRPHDVQWEPTPWGFRLGGWHDGYFRLPGKPRHERNFTWHDDGLLLIRDRITSGRSVSAVARLHLHPDCVVQKRREDQWSVDSPGGRLVIAFAGSGRTEVEEGFYCPQFGQSKPNRVLSLHAEGDDLEFGCCIVRGDKSVDFNLTKGLRVEGRSYGW